ncbi:hypothetical protein EI94DRAFT_1707644 [Lactarius quietus]|nr:hypothetical protein EI94DRAFT_1707644 [Lactarius quietus]
MYIPGVGIVWDSEHAAFIWARSAASDFGLRSPFSTDDSVWICLVGRGSLCLVAVDLTGRTRIRQHRVSVAVWWLASGLVLTVRAQGVGKKPPMVVVMVQGPHYTPSLLVWLYAYEPKVTDISGVYLSPSDLALSLEGNVEVLKPQLRNTALAEGVPRDVRPIIRASYTNGLPTWCARVYILISTGDWVVGEGTCETDGQVRFRLAFSASCPWVTGVGGSIRNTWRSQLHSPAAASRNNSRAPSVPEGGRDYDYLGDQYQGFTTPEAAAPSTFPHRQSIGSHVFPAANTISYEAQASQYPSASASHVFHPGASS